MAADPATPAAAPAAEADLMLRPTRKGGKAAIGGMPSQLRGSLSRSCPTCDMGPGKACVVWRTHEGERLYPIKKRCKPHPERVHPT